MLKFTTETGRVYYIDLEGGFWFRSPYFSTQRLWDIRAGSEKVWPWDKPEVWEDRVPEVGEHLYIASREVWFVSTLIVSIEEVENLPIKE